MDIIKITIFVIILTILIVVIREFKPEFAVVIQIGAIGVIAFLIMSSLGGLLKTTLNIAEMSLLNSEFFLLMIKALGIAIVTQIATGICDDSDNKTLAFGVELAGKVTILAMCIPMIKAVAGIAVQMIKG
ncbi:MAG: SpoIIIAC/SpoIIIAD family protein [Oscillospiraceae bacterium]